MQQTSCGLNLTPAISHQPQVTSHKPLSSSVACRLLSGAFRGWCQAADKLCQQTLANGYEEVAGQVGSMKAENERLRRDNERFVRLIDSGEWGRGRVAELTQAGECPIAAVCLKSFVFDLLCVNSTSVKNWMAWCCAGTCVNQSSARIGWIVTQNGWTGA
jgi:hypothetical protein